MPGKFDSPRDEALYIMSVNGWANTSGGDVEAPTGHFVCISNAPNEISEICEVFSEEFANLDFTDEALIGHFLCVEDSQGFWHVITYDTEAELFAMYAAREAEYGIWTEG